MKKYPQAVEAFGRSIRRLRMEKGLSQQELADECEVERPTIARIEAGKYGVGLHIIYALAEALGVEPAELFPKNAT